MDIGVLESYIPLYKDALILTLKIGWQGIALSFVIGLAGAAILHFKVRVLKTITGIYIELFRNTPLLVQLFFIYFALPKVGVRVTAEACGILGLGLLGGAYMIETFRSGVSRSQHRQRYSGILLYRHRQQDRHAKHYRAYDN